MMENLRKAWRRPWAAAACLGLLCGAGAFAEPAAFALHPGERVVFLGNTFPEREQHHCYLETLLMAAYPEHDLSFRNLGWAGDTVHVQLRPLGFGDLASNLGAVSPNVVFVYYGHNEAFDGLDALPAFISGYAKMLDMIASLGARAVVVSPIPHERKPAPLPDPEAHNARIEAYTRALEQLASERGLPFVDLFARLGRHMAESGPALTDNGIHLNAYGYWLAALETCDALGLYAARPPEPAPLESPLEAAVSGEGFHVEAVSAAADGVIAIQGRPERLPPPPLPLDAPSASGPPLAARAAPAIRISGLPPGRYRLETGGATVAEADAAAWAEGVPIRCGPAAEQMAALHETLLAKTQYFFFRWRAHNGEYIYGRRAEEGGGNAGNPQFEEEHARFDALAEEGDAAAAVIARPAPAEYILRGGEDQS